MQKHRHLPAHITIECYLQLMHLRFYAVGAVYKLITKDMIKMTVRMQEVFHLYTFGGNVITQSFLLFRHQCAAIYDDAFLRFIVQDVAIFLHHIKYKAFNL